MSFGFGMGPEPIRKAVKEAYYKEVLMFASASDCGGNNRITWPARDERVICINATTGNGNKYPATPTPRRNQYNFATLGSSVRAWWPPKNGGPAKLVYRARTSTATPVAAGIAAFVIDLLRKSREEYLKQSEDRASLEKQYDRSMRRLHTNEGMKAVFKSMVEDEGRDGYDYVAPWRVLNNEYATPFGYIDRLLEVLGNV